MQITISIKFVRQQKAFSLDRAWRYLLGSRLPEIKIEDLTIKTLEDLEELRKFVELIRPCYLPIDKIN